MHPLPPQIDDSYPPAIDRAVALRWDGDGAPHVTAKGHGPIAEQIIQLASRHNVPLREDPDLVKLLIHIDLGAEIPPTLYIAVAEVIAFAYAVTAKVHRTRSPD